MEFKMVVKYRKELESLAKKLSSNQNTDEQFQALTEELRKCAADCFGATFIIKCGLFDRCIEYLKTPPRQFQAAMVLIHTIRNIWNPDKRQLKILLHILKHSAHPDLQQSAVEALGSVASVSEVRELVHTYGAVQILLDKIIGVHQQCSLPLLRAATSTLLALCKGKRGVYETVKRIKRKRKGKVSRIIYHYHGSCKARHLNKVIKAFPALCRIVEESVDDVVLTNVCSIFTCLTCPADMTDNEVVKLYFPLDFPRSTCERLVQLIKEYSDGPCSFVTPAFCTIANIASRENEMKLLLESKIITCLSNLLREGRKEKEVCRILQIMTDKRRAPDKQTAQDVINAVVDNELIDPLLKLVETAKEKGEWHTEMQAARSISNCIAHSTRIKELIAEERLCKFTDYRKQMKNGTVFFNDDGLPEFY